VSPCPPSELLDRLMNAAVTQGEEARLEQHLDECAACRDRLESLVSQQPVFARLSGRLRSDACPSEPENRLQHVVDAFVDEVARLRPVLKPTQIARSISPDESQADDRSNHGITGRGGGLRRYAAVFGTILVLCWSGWMAVSSLLLSQSDDPSEPAQVQHAAGSASTDATGSGLAALSSWGSESFLSSLSASASAAVVVHEDGVAPASFDALGEALKLVSQRFGAGNSPRSLVVTCRPGVSVATSRLFVPAGCQLAIIAEPSELSEASEPALPASRPLLVLSPDSPLRSPLRSPVRSTSCSVCGRLILNGISIQGRSDIGSQSGSASGSDIGSAGRAEGRSTLVDLFDVEGGEVVIEDCRVSSDIGTILRLRSQGSAVLKNCDLYAGYRTVFAVAADSPRFVLDDCLVTGQSLIEVAYGASRSSLAIDINRSRLMGRELLRLVPAPGVRAAAQCAMNPAVKLTVKNSVLASPIVAVAELLPPTGNSTLGATAAASSTELSRLLSLTDERTRFLTPHRSPAGLSGIKASELSAIFPAAQTSNRSIAYMPTDSNSRQRAYSAPHEATVANFDWLTLPR